jgi:hypothetical protein
MLDRFGVCADTKHAAFRQSMEIVVTEKTPHPSPPAGTEPRGHCSSLASKGVLVSSEPIRQPANDLIAFDISRQSPEQIAQMFARWKERRKRLQAVGSQRSSRPPHLKPVPPITRGAEEAAPTASASAEPGGPVRYSASFESVLAARAPTLAQRVWNPDAGLAKLGRPHAPRRRSRMKWALAGAASVVAAVAAGALWEQSAGRPGWPQAGDKPAADTSLIASPAEAALSATPPYLMDIPMAEPFVMVATASGEADWPMRQAVDLALMKAAPVAVTAHLPLMPQLRPPVPAVQTASKPSATKPAPQPDAEPSEAGIAPVELPLMPSVTTETVSVVAPAADARADDPRRDDGVSRGNDKSNFPFGTNNGVASSSGRPAAGPDGPANPGSGSSGGAGTGGSGDPSGGTGGDGSGSSGDPAGGTGGGDSDAVGGSADGGGIGGAIGGAVGGLGDALGGALGGGKGSAKSDKDKDKGKDKDKDKGKDKGKAD